MATTLDYLLSVRAFGLSAPPPPSGRGGDQACVPPQAEPLLNIVSEASPQPLAENFLQATHAKLPESERGLQPRVGKFRQGGAQAIKGSCRFGAHLGHVRCLHLRNVMYHPIEGDQLLATQDPQQWCEQLIQRLLVLNAEVRQLVMIDDFAPCQPLVGGMVAAAPIHFPRRTDLFAVGLNPQTDQQVRIEGRTPRHPLHRAHVGGVARPVQLARQFSHRPRQVVGLHQLLHVRRPEHQLVPVHRLEANGSRSLNSSTLASELGNQSEWRYLCDDMYLVPCC